MKLPNNIIDDIPINKSIRTNFSKFISKYPLTDKEYIRILRLVPKKRIGFLFGKVIRTASLTSDTTIRYYVHQYDTYRTRIKMFKKNNLPFINSTLDKLKDDNTIFAEHSKEILTAIDDKYQLINYYNRMQTTSEIILNLLLKHKQLL